MNSAEDGNLVDGAAKDTAAHARRAPPTAFASAAFHRLQLRHFLLFDLVPALAALAAVPLSFRHPPDTVDLALLAVFWLATGLGLTVGYHRYFSHRAFAAARPIDILLLVLGSMAARGPMISWAAMHRRHHERADREGDLHSPNLHGSGLRGWLHAHVTWMVRHDYPNVMHYTPDLLRDKLIVRLNRHYYLWVALGLALPALLGGVLEGSLTGAFTGFFWGGIIRLFIVAQTMSTINSVCHLAGSRPFATRERSRNNAWLGLFTWGEAHHNNHHAFSNSAAFGLRWHELDPGFWFIRLLESCGLARAVKRPTAAQIALRAAHPDAEP